MTSLSEQLRALGLDGRDCTPFIVERAELESGRFDRAKTLARVRMDLEFYERQLGEMRAFASKWGAPMHEVTDNYEEYSLNALRLRQAVELLEAST